MSARVERVFRGITGRAAVMYLERIGGEAVDEETVEGDGWRASVSGGHARVGPTLRIDEVTVAVEGDAARVEAVVAAFERKALRAGG